MILVDRVIELVPFLTLGILGFVTLGFAAGTLRSARRTEQLSEDRLDLLRDHHERLELMREERRMLLEELERESRERQQLIESLKEVGQQPPKTGKQNAEVAKRAAQQEQERLRIEQELHRLEEELEREREERAGIQRELERFGLERQGLTEDLETERQEHRETQQRAEQQGQDRTRLEQEIDMLKTKLDRQERARTRTSVERPGAPLPWWRRPALVVGLLFGVLVAWFASLVVALNLLSS
jgi:F0F1-type ATP synthase assembly protein I